MIEIRTKLPGDWGGSGRGETGKEHKEILGGRGNGNVCYFDRVVNYTSICTCQNSPNHT